MDSAIAPMIPIDKAPEGKTTLSETVKLGQTPAGKAMKFEHRGSYEDIDSTYEAITAYLDEKGLEADNLFVEEYLNEVKDLRRPQPAGRHLCAAQMTDAAGDRSVRSRRHARPIRGRASCARRATRSQRLNETTGRNAPIPEESSLDYMIGPPLRDSFAILVGADYVEDDDGLLPRALPDDRPVRERGLCGRSRGLGGSARGGLSASSSRHRRYEADARRILEHFDLAKYFNGIYGSQNDGGRAVKSELLAMS